MEKVTLVPVYNDILTSYKNSINRGWNTWRFTALDYMVKSFRDNIGKLDQIRRDFPDVEILPVDCSGNQGVHQVSIEDALKWDYTVKDSDLNQVYSYLYDLISNGQIDASSIPAATGDILSIKTADPANIQLARQISKKVDEIMEEYKLR